MPDLPTRLGQLSALAEPVRRDLYTFVVARREPVTREQAAAGLDVPVHVAKFHLDRLVEDGLLDAEYRRPPGRGGPGAGRPAKVYRRSGLEVEVSLPERRYAVAGRVLVKAVAYAEREGVPIADALARDETELVCGMNLCFLEGVLDGVGADGLAAELDPRPGQCCVHLRKV